MSAKAQVLVRLSEADVEFIDSRVGGARKRAAYLRRLLAHDRKRAERAELEEMFAAAAASLTQEEREEEREERRVLVNGFANRP